MKRITKYGKIFTILRNVLSGLRNVSPNLRAGGFFGLLLGVCTAQHLMNRPIKMIKAIPISRTAHQNS